MKYVQLTIMAFVFASCSGLENDYGGYDKDQFNSATLKLYFASWACFTIDGISQDLDPRFMVFKPAEKDAKETMRNALLRRRSLGVLATIVTIMDSQIAKLDAIGKVVRSTTQDPIYIYSCTLTPNAPRAMKVSWVKTLKIDK